MNNIKPVTVLLSLILNLGTCSATAGEVEVLHWWTSGGEDRAVTILKDKIESQGNQWKDFAIAGGGGDSAMTVLKTRAVSGNPPSAAQLKGHELYEWGQLGFLMSLNDIAQEEHWQQIIPAVARDIMMYHGNYLAVPINIHRVNWLWANPEIFAKVGVKVPVTLDDFFTAAEKIKQAGYIPLAHGGQPWQNMTLFEAVALAVLGAEDYNRAFVELDMTVLSGDKMVEVFTQFRRMHDYIDPEYRGRDWNTATEMVSRGDAAMQIMGDWVKGEFEAEGKIPGKDYICVAAPGTDGKFTYNIDSFAFFKLRDKAAQQAQKDLARAILDKSFQSEFNRSKGSIPIRMDMDLSNFDQCAQDSQAAFKQTIIHGGLVPSVSQGLATTSYVQAAIFDVVNNFFDAKTSDPVKAADRLARAVKSAM